jgi:hypothetical protein
MANLNTVAQNTVTYQGRDSKQILDGSRGIPSYSLILEIQQNSPQVVGVPIQEESLNGNVREKPFERAVICVPAGQCITVSGISAKVAPIVALPTTVAQLEAGQNSFVTVCESTVIDLTRVQFADPTAPTLHIWSASNTTVGITYYKLKESLDDRLSSSLVPPFPIKDVYSFIVSEYNTSSFNKLFLGTPTSISGWVNLTAQGSTFNYTADNPQNPILKTDLTGINYVEMSQPASQVRTFVASPLLASNIKAGNEFSVCMAVGGLLGTSSGNLDQSPFWGWGEVVPGFWFYAKGSTEVGIIATPTNNPTAPSTLPLKITSDPNGKHLLMATFKSKSVGGDGLLNFRYNGKYIGHLAFTTNLVNDPNSEVFIGASKLTGNPAQYITYCRAYGVSYFNRSLNQTEIEQVESWYNLNFKIY